ncbi:HypC/HybG/HupF family hydrogenase formation chaperone [Candidatus Frankia alpina]|uniref:HypC/HybG/HupF family hydrogenase formation chaperone n=1 Tax=Candidatus Frankia alpina TaxID=2699483 RepID=UPI0013D8699D|nr:HypC/HybG/HupF family hydrogenase formation chaperone [Candidatus Frankia alpina]
MNEQVRSISTPPRRARDTRSPAPASPGRRRPRIPEVGDDATRSGPERLSAWEAARAAAHPGPEAPVCGAAGQVAGPGGTIEAEIVRCLPGSVALVRTPAGTEEIGLALVQAHMGDTVLVHAGEAITVL